MSSDLSEIVIRMATEEDYDGVIGIIPNLYDGRDYMPSCYYDMLKDPKRFMVIAELQGEIIGMEMYYVVDDDKTVIGEAGRIKACFRRKKLSQRLFYHAFLSISQKYPEVKQLSYTSQNEEEIFRFRQSSAWMKSFYRYLVRITSGNKMILKDAVTSTEFERLCKGLPLDKTKPLTPTEAVNALDKVLHNSSLLSDYAWIVNFEPFKPVHSNHVTITHNNTRGIPVVMATEDRNGDICAVSFGAVTVIKSGIMFTIDFYCHKSWQQDDRGRKLLDTHLLRQMLLFNQVRGDFRRVVLDVVVGPDIDTHQVFDCFINAGLKNYDFVQRKKKVYAVEANSHLMFSSKI